MAGNNDNGNKGPWGSSKGNKGNPWGSGDSKRPNNRGRGNRGGGGGGGNQPDLEEMLRRGQKKMQDGFSKGGNFMLAVIIIGLIGLWLASGSYIVQDDEQGVVLRFGKYVGHLDAPGLSYHLPWPIETVIVPKVTNLNNIEIGFRTIGQARDGHSSAAKRDIEVESLMLTGDENIVDVDFTVQWRIDQANITDYLFNVRDPEQTIRRTAESVMREIIGSRGIQAVIVTERDVIIREVREELQQLMNEYALGVIIDTISLENSAPPQGTANMGDAGRVSVIDAFNDVQRADTDNERVQNEARLYQNRILEEVQGDVERITAQAEAYRAEVTLAATGEANRFNQVLEAYRLAPEVTQRRLYLETMEEVMQNSNMVILEGDKSGDSGVVPYLPLNEIMTTPAARATSAASATSATQNTGR